MKMKRILAVLLALALGLAMAAPLAAAQEPQLGYPNGAVVFVRQPEDQAVGRGMEFTLTASTLTVNDEGVADVKLQWYRLSGRYETAVAGATNPSLTLSTMQFEADAPKALSFYCKATAVDTAGRTLSTANSRAAEVAIYWSVGQVFGDWTDYISDLFNMHVNTSIGTLILNVLDGLFAAPWRNFFLVVKGQFKLWFEG